MSEGNKMLACQPYWSMGGRMYSYIGSDFTASSCLMHDTYAKRDWISVRFGTYKGTMCLCNV